MHIGWPVKTSGYFRRAVTFSENKIQTVTAKRNIYMSAYEAHLRIICAVCERLIQPGKKGSETIVGVCDECRRQSHLEAKHHHARQLLTTTEPIVRDFVLMKSSTKDKIKGGFKEAKGKVKEKAGKATGDPDLRDRGTLERAGGKVQRKIGDVKKVFE